MKVFGEVATFFCFLFFPSFPLPVPPPLCPQPFARGKVPDDVMNTKIWEETCSSMDLKIRAQISGFPWPLDSAEGKPERTEPRKGV